MLQDEKASFARDVHPITEEVLDTVANHIRNSSRKPGCIASKIPLVFVFGPEQSLDKFVQEFQRMSLREYQLIQEGKYYYLALKRTNSLEHSSSFSSNRFVSKHLIVQSNPHWNDATELRELLESTEDTRNNSTLHNHLHDILDSGNGLNPNEEENNVGRAINDKVKGNYKGPRYAKDRRRHSDRMRGKKELVLDQTVIEIDAFSLEGGSLQSTEDVTLRDRSSSTEDETKERKNYIPGSETEHFSAPKQHPIRRRKRSLGPLSTPNITKNSTEDGLDK